MKTHQLAFVVALVALISSGNSARAQEYAFGSALSQGVAGVVTLLPWSPSVLETHPALMAFAIGATSVELSYRQLYGLSDLEEISAQARHRLHRMSGGLALNKFGEAGLYEEYNVIGAGSFQVLTNFSLGAALQYKSEEYGEGLFRYSGEEVALSGAYKPVPSVLFSGAIRRLMVDDIYNELETDPVYEASIAWASRSEVALGAIWTRERQGEHRYAVGQILRLTQNLDFLAGLRFDPVRYSLGGRASFHDMSLVYAYEGHPELGSTHSFGFSWSR